jgi:hypothetical protein
MHDAHLVNFTVGDLIMDPVVQSVVINRPIAEVFDVATCQERCVIWRGPIVFTAKTSDGPSNVGSTYIHKVKFLGVTVEANPVITAWEPPYRAEVKNKMGLITYTSTFTCEEVEGGTKLTTIIQAETGGALKHIPDALVHKAIMRQHAGDLQALKDMMENEIAISKELV